MAGGYGYSGNTNGNYYYNLTQGVGSADQAANNAITAQGQMTGAQQKALQVANMAAMHGQTAGGSSYYGGPGATYGAGGAAGSAAAGGASYGAGGAFNGGGSLPASYQQALDAANAANTSRYNEAKGDITTQNAQNAASLATGNQQNLQDIATAYQGQASQNSQDMIDRGLTGSTVAANVANDTMAQGTQAANRENFNYQQATRDTNTQGTNNLVNLIASKNDIAPDMNALVALSQAYGNSGGGMQQNAAGFGGAGGLGGGLQAGYGALGSMGAGLGALGSDYGQPTYAGNAYQYPTNNGLNSSQYAALMQNQAQALGGNYYNSGYSLGGASGSALQGPSQMPYGDASYNGYYYGNAA